MGAVLPKVTVKGFVTNKIQLQNTSYIEMVENIGLIIVRQSISLVDNMKITYKNKEGPNGMCTYVYDKMKIFTLYIFGFT